MLLNRKSYVGIELDVGSLTEDVGGRISFGLGSLLYDMP